MQQHNEKEVTYALQGIVGSNMRSIMRYIIGVLGVPFIKSILGIIPGIDNSVYAKGDKGDFYIEIVPSFLGLFSPQWHIRVNRVQALIDTGAKIRAIHAPYIDDGKVFQSQHRTYLDNVLDLTEHVSQTWFCLYSHVHLFEMLAPKEQSKVLIVHPLPSSPYKTEKQILMGIVKNVKKVLPVIKDQGVTLAIENMPWLRKRHERYTTFMGDALFYERLMNEINDDAVGVIFDWGHANSYARYMYDHGIPHPEHDFALESLAKFSYQQYFIEKLQSKMVYAHLHFNEAHLLDGHAPFHAKNYDSHGDLTLMTDEEYTYFKKNVRALKQSPNLIGITVESIPSYTNRKKRIQRYKDSIEILNSMLQS